MLCRSRWPSRLLAVVALLWLAGCGSSPSAPLSLDQLYQRAVVDARVAEPSEVSHALEPLVPANSHLRWRTVDGQPQVELVTWTSYTGYDALVGQGTTLAREVWVTCVPALHDAVAASGAADRELRAAQLLGLPPKPGKTRFVEFWVTPASVFRPAADPDVTTDTAPADSVPGLPLPGVGTSYLNWYNALKASSYGASGYPWTRLGYTYDWGRPAHEEGLSEFVIRAGAQAEIAGVTANREYL